MSDYRERCLEEKGEQCTICCAESKIIVHHIDGDRDNNSLDNLVPLCGACHNRVHRARPGFGEWAEELPEDSLIPESTPRRGLCEETAEAVDGVLDFSLTADDYEFSESYQVYDFQLSSYEGKVEIEFHRERVTAPR